MVVVVEDLNVAWWGRWGEHAPSELLRQVLEHHCIYDTSKPEDRFDIADTRLLITLLARPGGHADLPDRLDIAHHACDSNPL